jgi:hypothetical protein
VINDAGTSLRDEVRCPLRPLFGNQLRWAVSVIREALAHARDLLRSREDA